MLGTDAGEEIGATEDVDLDEDEIFVICKADQGDSQLLDQADMPCRHLGSGFERRVRGDGLVGNGWRPLSRRRRRL
jgi:hypothetical protein